jgi:1-acyl-sn-glycerol-3-phosphate acyltransferase
MLLRIYSGLFWSFLTLTSVGLFPVAVVIWAVTAPFDRRRRILHAFTSWWANLYTWLNPAWSVTVKGRQNIPRDRACVMVANHLSLLDILVMFRLRTHFKWVSKVENFKVPFIGWNMKLNRYIELTRGNRASILQMMRAAEDAIAEGDAIMMFPEGTRSPSGRLRSFKPGAFELALRCRVPILPIVIQGTHDALPKAGFVLRGKHPISLEVLEPIAYEKFADMKTEEISHEVRDLIASHLDESKLTGEGATS